MSIIWKSAKMDMDIYGHLRTFMDIFKCSKITTSVKVLTDTDRSIRLKGVLGTSHALKTVSTSQVELYLALGGFALRADRRSHNFSDEIML